MTSRNQHIRNYLDYYVSLQTPPGFAVLISGQWGSGKTWFVKNYCSTPREDEIKFLYASLYGVKSTNEIAQLFLEELYPLLETRGMKAAAKVSNILFKAASNKAVGDSIDGSFAVNLLMEFLTNATGHVLVFDDLERCSIEIPDILGYINQFVEHRNYKVIIVANEDELELETGEPASSSSDFESSPYRRIKEKIIGKTFRVHPQLHSATESFIEAIDDEKFSSFLNSNTEMIQNLYLESGYENLRFIRYAILDFWRVFQELDVQHNENSDLMHVLLSQFLVYSYEVQKGAILPQSLHKIKDNYYSKLTAKVLNRDEPDSYLATISKKYSASSLESPLVPEKLFEVFFQYGAIDKKGINTALAQSRFYFDSKTPNWQRLLDLWSLSNEEFDSLLASVRSDYNNRVYDKTGIVKHISGMLLWLVKNNLISDSVDEIAADAKSYIDQLKNKGQLDDEFDDFGRFVENDAYAGLGFWGREINEFSDLCTYIRRMAAEAKAEALPKAGEELLETMKSDIGLFVRRLIHSNSEDNLYYNTPILVHVEANDFVLAMLNIPRGDWRTIASVLKKRYEHSIMRESLVEELPWLESVKELFNKELIKHKGTLDEFRIKSLIENYLAPAIILLSPPNCPQEDAPPKDGHPNN